MTLDILAGKLLSCVRCFDGFAARCEEAAMPYRQSSPSNYWGCARGIAPKLKRPIHGGAEPRLTTGGKADEDVNKAIERRFDCVDDGL